VCRLEAGLPVLSPRDKWYTDECLNEVWRIFSNDIVFPDFLRFFGGFRWPIQGSKLFSFRIIIIYLISFWIAGLLVLSPSISADECLK
jgi:hypothetical protein